MTFRRGGMRSACFLFVLADTEQGNESVTSSYHERNIFFEGHVGLSSLNASLPQLDTVNVVVTFELCIERIVIVTVCGTVYRRNSCSHIAISVQILWRELAEKPAD